MASRRHCARGRPGGLKWQRARQILALVPPEAASSTDSSSSEDEVIIQNITERQDDVPSDFSSEPRSLRSSLENLDLILDSPVQEEIFSTLSDEDTVPLTPVIRSIFSSDTPPNPLPNLNSVSSILSPLNTPLNQRVRSKRSANCEPRVVAKRVKKYKRIPLSFKWQRGKFKYPAEFDLPDFSTSSTATESPSDYFQKFFSEDIIDYITEHTNLYSVQSKEGKSINVTRDDMRDFLAITIMMGIVRMPSYRDYWSNDFRYPPVADVMSLKKYELMRKYLHYVDNSDLNNDRYFKVRPILEKVRTNCLRLEEEGRYSIDEMMVPYKGTRAGNRRQYLPKKPKKWGFKLFVRAGVSGLVYDFHPYGGDDTFRFISFSDYEDSLGLGAKVVIALCKTIVNKPAVVYYDNFFTSLELIHLLREDYGIFSLGTIKGNRLRGCADLLASDKKLAKKGRGSSHQIVCNSNKIAIVKWFDNKVVTLASSFVDSHPMVKIKRWSKETKTKTDVDCPQIVKQYNAHMGGVDLADMLVALYRSTFKTKRWYMAIFSQVIDISVNNAWLLYRRNLSPNQKHGMTLKKFRFQIFTELLQKNRVQGCVQEKDIPLKKKITAPTVSRPTDAVRFDKIGHFPVFVQRGRCKYCKNGYSNIHCSKCEQRLCLVPKRNCFYNFHNVE